VQASDLVFRALDLPDGGNQGIGRESERHSYGDGIVEEPGLGVRVCDADCGRERSVFLAISVAGSLQLAQAIPAARGVAVYGSHDTIEALLTSLQDGEEELAVVASSGLIQSSPGPRGGVDPSGGDDGDQVGIGGGIALAVPHEEEADHLAEARSPSSP
jgi:hypothetical protein